TRKPGEAVFSGSILRQGEADAMVYGTGTNTYFGKTVQLVEEAHTVSHFQKSVLKIGNYLIVLAVVLVAVIVTVALFRHDPALDTLEFALVLLVAAIPVAMPTVLSVTMAVGARLLAKKQVVVTRLAAIEELAGVDILCSDKTGTLTQNKLTLGDPFTVNNTPGDQVILWAALASRAEDKDTIDLAVIGGVKDDKELKSYQVLHFEPFDPVHKRTEATVKSGDGKQFFVAKGAPQVILEMSKNAGDVKPAVEKAVNDFAGRGFRSLGVARADEEGNWQFAGVLPMFDPPREQAKATIASAVQMGVKVKMVTGDQLAIARETAKQLGMGINILDASSLQDKKQQDDAQSSEAIEKADGYAQVFPEDKFHIIQVLQKRGHFVGMTGDGVNDAPALKQADCGIAVSGATDAARAAASIVLLAPGLSVIIDAIKEARRIVQRMNSYAIYRIAETLRVLLLMVFAILVFNFYPVTAVMIVMIAVLNDGAILSIAYDNVLYKDKPEAWNMRMVLGISTVLGVIGVVAAFGLFFVGDRFLHLSHPQLQTLMYLKLSVAGHLTIFLTRTRGPFWSIRPAKILWIAVLGTQTIATLIAVYGLFMTPLGWKLAGLVWAYAVVCFLLTDRVKLLGYYFLDHAKAEPKSEARVSQSKPDAKADASKPEVKAEAKSGARADEAKPAAKAELPKSEVKAGATSDAKSDAPKSDASTDPSKPETKDDVKLDAKAGEPKPEIKAEVKPDAKAEAKPDDNAEPQSEAKPKLPSDLKAQIATRAYELYKQRGDRESPAIGDWEQAERDIRKEEAQTDLKAQAKIGPETSAKPEAGPEVKAGSDSYTKPAGTTPVAKDQSKPETKGKVPSAVTPQLVKRVHALYEELGREEVQAVQEWEKSEPETLKK
ncbi:MAG TPA: plasma-membrane proton-efflux P-type ATPase, partial [Acidobacteriaceae bacterium]